MKKGFLNFIFISFLMILLIPKNAYASSFKVERSVDTVKPGSDVTVHIKSSITSGASIKENYKLDLSYDSSKFDIKTKDDHGYSDIGVANPITITGKKLLDSDITVATIVFTAKGNASAGDATFAINNVTCDTLIGTCDASNNTMVKVSALSSDATLSSLKIPNATITPKFDKNVFEYQTTITDITEITVNAVASNPNSKILISDNYKNLQKGDNDIKISVTAEDGKTVKNYLIKVKLKITPTEEELLKANTKLKKLEIKNYDIDFSNELKKYTLTVPYKTTKLAILAEPENEKATVQMEGSSNKLKVGRNLIKVVVISEDEENKDTYTLVVTREKEEKKIVQTCPDSTSKKEWIIFSVCLFLTFTLGIVLGYFLCKKEILNKLFKKKEKDIEEKLSDTIEVVNKDDLK